MSGWRRLWPSWGLRFLDLDAVAEEDISSNLALDL
jgi:hypothetical protein